MKYLVTGGAGFIGTNALRYLKRQYPNADLISFDIAQPKFPVEGVSYVHGDVRSFLHLRNVVKGADRVFHLAAELGTHETFTYPDTTNEVNLQGTVNLLELAKDYGFPLFLASKPNVWLNPYSISKEAAERYAMMYAQEYKTKVVVLKWFSVYGPYQYIHKYQKAVPTFIYKALKQEPIPVYGDGKQEADFVFVEDAVIAADIAISKRLFGEIIEFGWGKGVEINALVKKIIQLTNSHSEIKYLPMRKGEDLNAKIFANMRKANTLLRYKPTVSLDEGLARTIAFYKEALHLFP